jgi:hypothetical protein
MIGINGSTYFFILTQLYMLFPLINSLINECPRDMPILKAKNCTLTYCSETDFKSKICTVNNPIINTQWLNHIIIIGAQSFRYINFAELANGNILIEANSPTDSTRMFYGMKTNGRPLFIIETKETLFYSKSTEAAQEVSEGSIIKNTYSDKEFYFSISKGYNVEIFDIENFQIYKRSSDSFAGIEIYSIKQNVFPDKSSSADTFFICFVAKAEGDDKYSIYLQKQIFRNLNDVQSNKEVF